MVLLHFDFPTVNFWAHTQREQQLKIVIKDYRYLYKHSLLNKR